MVLCKLVVLLLCRVVLLLHFIALFRCLVVGLLLFGLLLKVDRRVVFVVECIVFVHFVVCSVHETVACILGIWWCWHTSIVVGIFHVCKWTLYFFIWVNRSGHIGHW